MSKPILFNSGKVLTNSTRSDNGQWNIPCGGFTDQFRVKLRNSDFASSAEGFYLPPKPANYEGILPMPDIWLMEYYVENLLGNAAQWNGARYWRRGRVLWLADTEYGTADE